MKTPTKSKTSPKGGRRGCVCPDGTYSKECCDGTLQAQGIGGMVSQGSSTIVNTNTERVVVGVNG